MADSLALLVFALACTVAIEVAIAAAFGLRRRGLAAVALVSVVTNPTLNLLLLFASMSSIDGIGFAIMIVVLEVGVIVTEWELLRWALNDPSRKLLILAIVMNVASALAGIVILPVAEELGAWVWIWTQGSNWPFTP